ncbi:branched-chain amino acid ABC transporter permease [soil metagenome]
MRWLRDDTRGREALFMAAAAFVLFASPWIMPAIGGYRALATRMIIWAIFALGFDILLGLTGLLSFGHAAMWGIGIYSAGYFLLHAVNDALLAILVGVAVVAVVSLLLGLITLRRHGIYFAILTLAFAEMFYFLALAPLQRWTGGDNGLTGIPHPQMLGWTPEGYSLHAIIAAFGLLALYVARRISRSPSGLMMRAIKANEARLAFTGVDVFRYKLLAFVISGVYAGLAGTLYAVYEKYAPTDSLHWTTSGEVVIMSVIGGVGTLVGPMLGAATVLYLENVLSAETEQWNLILGLVFMAFVIFLRGGIVGALQRVLRARRPERVVRVSEPVVAET